MYWRTSMRSHICAKSSQYSRLVKAGLVASAASGTALASASCGAAGGSGVCTNSGVVTGV